MLTNEYCAGFFDGEGTATAQRLIKVGNRRYDYYRTTAAIGNTNLLVLQTMQKGWGGTISAGKKDPRHKQQYTWKLSTKQIVPFLQAIRPYLIVKAAVVDKVLELQALAKFGRRTISIEAEQQRFDLFVAIRGLNKRGDSQPDKFELPKEFVPVVADHSKTITHKMVVQIRKRWVRGDAVSAIATDLQISRDSVRLIGQGKHRITHPKDRESLILLRQKRPKLSKKKSHCKRGHRFTKANTGIAASGWRWCRKCMHLLYLAKIGK